MTGRVAYQWFSVPSIKQHGLQQAEDRACGTGKGALNTDHDSVLTTHILNEARGVYITDEPRADT